MSIAFPSYWIILGTLRSRNCSMSLEYTMREHYDRGSVHLCAILRLDMVNKKDERFGCENVCWSWSEVDQFFPPEVTNSHTHSILLLLVTVFVPGETLLVEGYDDLWALQIGLFGKH